MNRIVVLILYPKLAELVIDVVVENCLDCFFEKHGTNGHGGVIFWSHTGNGHGGVRGFTEDGRMFHSSPIRFFVADCSADTRARTTPEPNGLDWMKLAGGQGPFRRLFLAWGGPTYQGAARVS
jgi:hypothetical protein